VLVRGFRQTGRASFVGLTPDQLLLEAATPRGATPCSGDPGSLQFLGDTDIEVSLMHGGDDSCKGTVAAQRLDTQAEQAFLAPYLPAR
jgi:hypothetical protein